MTNSHASDDPLLGFDWSVQDERQSDSKSAPSPKFEKKNIASPDAQFLIFADNSRPGRAKSPYHENAMAKKPQHLCGALQYFSIVQFGYAVFMFFIWAYTITILGVSGLNAAFYLTFIGICSVSGWKIQNLELFGISLAWVSVALLGTSTFYYAYLALEIEDSYPNEIPIITFFFIMCIVSLVQASISIAFLKNRDSKRNIHSYFR